MSSFPSSESGEPTWRVALFYPQQGGWSERDYLALDGGPLVEYDDGYLEVQDMPTKEHQRMVQFLFVLLQRYTAEHRCGEAFVAPLPVRLWPRKYREPDVVFVSNERGEFDGYPDGADLVMEIVSQGQENRRRDLEIKPDEYLQARIAEYWVIDPQTETVTVHCLVGEAYQTHSHNKGVTAHSQLLPGFSISVAAILNSAIKQDLSH